MKEVCLITYTRCNEGFTDELDKIARAFYEEYSDSFKVVVCCEEKFDIDNTMEGMCNLENVQVLWDQQLCKN